MPTLHPIRLITFSIMLFYFLPACSQDKSEVACQPERINKCIELLERGQPIYYAAGYGGYDKGKEMAQTWADYIIYNMEHNPQRGRSIACR